MNIPPEFSRILPGDFESSPPILALIAANLVTIILAVLENWDLATVLFIYWAQSIIIGAFTVISILSADTELLAADMGTSQAEHGGTTEVSSRYVGFYKCAMAGFFTLHYGLFHWGYYGFIVESGIFGTVDFSNSGIWASCALFFFNHLYSHLYHEGDGIRGSAFINREFFEPYNRIIPMHMTIIFGSIVIVVLGIIGITTVMPVLVIFLALKTRVDIGMHLRKHLGLTNPDQPVQLIGF
jgi:hypothetical protein